MMAGPDYFADNMEELYTIFEMRGGGITTGEDSSGV